MVEADVNINAEEIFGPEDGPTVNVAAAVETAKEIAACADGDEQAMATAIKERLLPILHRLSPTDREVAITAVAKQLPIGVTALREESREFRRAIDATAKATDADTGGAAKPSQADLLFQIATSRYELLRGEDGAPYAIPVDGPRIARPLRGSGSLRAELAAVYAEKFNKVPGTAAVANALLAVEGKALQEPPTAIELRYARRGNIVWIDLGRQDGAAVAVSGAGWTVIDEDVPVVFRRSPLTAEMPLPERDGDVEALRRIIHMLDDEAWELIVGWTIGAMIPDIPRPVLFMVAEAGSAKTTTERMLVNLIDSSPSPTAKVPRDERDWIVSASGSAVVALDNVGWIAPWLSDALCRAVTGEGFPRRRLYSDNDIVVTHFRRAIIITGIDISADRGDLLDRCVPVELRRIPDDRRREEKAVLAEFEEARPAIFGGLLDVLSATLRELPNVELEQLPRMADYARVLAALDLATGWETLPAYLSATRDALAAGASSDLVAAAVIDLLDETGTWEGIASELLVALGDRHGTRKPPKRWPTTPNHLARRLRLAAPSLRAAGYTINDDRLHPKLKTPVWSLAAPADGNAASSAGSARSDELPTPFSEVVDEKSTTETLWEERL